MKVTEKYTREEFEKLVAKWAVVGVIVVGLVWVALMIFWTPWALIFVPAIACMVGLVICGAGYCVFAIVETATDFVTAGGDHFRLTSLKEADDE